MIMAALSAVAGCFTQPPPPPSTDSAPNPRIAKMDRDTLEKTLSFWRSHLRWIPYIGSIRPLGVEADIGVIADLSGCQPKNSDDLEWTLISMGSRISIHDHENRYWLNKTTIDKFLASNGMRGLHILCAEARLERNRSLLGYMRETDLWFGGHRFPVMNVEAALPLFEKSVAIEEAWLDALKSGMPMAEAKRNRVRSQAAFLQELVEVRTQLPPHDGGVAPQLPEIENGIERTARTLERTKRIQRKLARQMDASEWTAVRTAKHEVVRAAVQTWLLAVEKRLEAENAYLQALKRNEEPPAQPLRRARYASYTAFADACAAAANAEWLPHPPSFIAQKGAERHEDWRLDPSTAALEKARATAAVWRIEIFPKRNTLLYMYFERKHSSDEWKKAFMPSTFDEEWEASLEWWAAVKRWQAALADESAGEEEKCAAAEAALAASGAYRAAKKFDIRQFVEKERLYPLLIESETRYLDIETAIYEIVVYKIAESMAVAMDIENIYSTKVRLACEERAAAALEQLVAVKEWKAALMDGRATEEEKRLAQDLAMAHGIGLWNLYMESLENRSSETHPLIYRYDSFRGAPLPAEHYMYDRERSREYIE
ncbi:MAG: hypothetical protein OXT69_09485 [Candidatus Poribacteria bacterium]|nr:hypothetical protein [Candidatus Poribacteria bacterium]